jgi:hypothetical protein
LVKGKDRGSATEIELALDAAPLSRPLLRELHRGEENFDPAAA